MPIRNIVTAALLLISFQSIYACAGVAPGGESVAFGDQEDVIIYNSKTQTEFFIRNAKFEAISPDFGFIAPTPSVPELSSVKPDLMKLFFSYEGMSRDAGMEILDEVKVAGYKATIIKANDRHAMTKWLTENKYQTSPSIGEWLDFYIKKGWFFTAFKVDNLKEIAETGEICMKFQTKTPFHPFYVPKDNWGRDSFGTLKVAIVSDYEYVASQLGDTSKPTRRFIHQTFTTKLTDFELLKVAEYVKCPVDALPTPAYVKVLAKKPFPTTAEDDMYFFPAEPQSLLADLFAPVL